MTYYLDTSALAKLYRDEAGSGYMQQLYESSATIYVSDLCRVEYLSICARRIRDREFMPEVLASLVEMLDDDLSTRFVKIPFADDIIAASAQLFSTVGMTTPLRSLDALHIAFYLAVQDSDSTFVTSDRHLISVCRSLGLKSIDPITS